MTAVLFTLSGVAQLFRATDWQDVVLAFFPAATWAGIALNTLTVERRHLPRARALYEDELGRATWQDLPIV
ncbi:hypothetical protein P9139_16625 [Curtobacterium flaccumfaciens]|nr:hypothetical protein P9139_16625 [Curtobacterium flaccumfaciens]